MKPLNTDPAAVLRMVDLVLHTDRAITITPKFKLTGEHGTPAAVLYAYEVRVGNTSFDTAEASTLAEALAISCWGRLMAFYAVLHREAPVMQELAKLLARENIDGCE